MKQTFYKLPIGIRYSLLSALGFALMAVCVKVSYADGIPVLEIVAVRALVSLVLSALDVRRKGISLLGQRKGLLIARGAVGALALICVYYSVTHLPLAEATVLQYLHPMFTALLALWFLREAVQRSTLFCVLFSFAGMVLVAKPDFLLSMLNGELQSLDEFAVLAAVLGAFGSAVAYVLVRKLNQTEDASVIIFYFPLIALPLALLLLGQDFVWPSGTTWLTLLAVGVFTQIGQIGLTKAMQTETASKATAFSYLQVPFSALLGWYFFTEVPDYLTLIGAGMILAAAMVNIGWKR